jgi:hypothetical protein
MVSEGNIERELCDKMNDTLELSNLNLSRPYHVFHHLTAASKIANS